MKDENYTNLSPEIETTANTGNQNKIRSKNAPQIIKEYEDDPVEVEDVEMSVVSFNESGVPQKKRVSMYDKNQDMQFWD